MHALFVPDHEAVAFQWKEERLTQYLREWNGSGRVPVKGNDECAFLR